MPAAQQDLFWLYDMPWFGYKANSSYPLSTGSRTEAKLRLQWSMEKSVGGDHMWRGCLLHRLATGTHCNCQQRDVLYMSQLISVFLHQSERLSWERGLNTEGTVQKQETKWMVRRALQMPANHVPNSLGGMQPIVNWICANAPESVVQEADGDWGQHIWPTSKPDHPLFPCACQRNFDCSNSEGGESYLCPLSEALISPNSCQLERSWPLLLVVRNCQSWEAESQTPW